MTALDGCPTWPPAFADRYRAEGYWTGETLGDLLRRVAAEHPLRPAVVGGDQRWTYAELDARVDGLVAGLVDLGIGPRDRVVLGLPNVPAFVEVLFALLRLGAIPVLALPSHRLTEIVHLATQSEAVAFVTCGTHERFDHRELGRGARERVPTLRHVIVADLDPGPHGLALDDLRGCTTGTLPDPPRGCDVALLQLSGGTTGLPKLIPRTHDDYAYSVRASAEICGLRPDSVYLAALPVAHNFPLSSPGVLGAVHAGACVVLAPRPTPDTVFGLIAAERVTITGVVPPLALAWMEAAPLDDRDRSSLAVLQVGGAKLVEAAARRVRPVLGCALQQVFGMAEGLVNYTRLDDPEELVVTTQGRPISPADEVRIVDAADRDLPPGSVGHLITRGPYTIRGYYRAPEHDATAFTADGFYRTGDLARVTPSGHLVVEGRAKDQINRGGEKIAPDEVENHLLAHPDVLDAAVIGQPDPYLGERTCAVVVIRGSAPPPARELLAFVRGRGIAAFKVPDRVEFVDAFPSTAVGKTSRRELREAVSRQLDALLTTRAER
jgi:2,3-dihydroxybenzoate-AMP ligase